MFSGFKSGCVVEAEIIDRIVKTDRLISERTKRVDCGLFLLLHVLCFYCSKKTLSSSVCQAKQVIKM